VWYLRTGFAAGAAKDFTKVDDMREPDKDYIADLERQVETDDFEGWERVPGRVSKNLTVTYAIRLSPEEHKLFAEAAEARGISLADLMRSATRAAIKGELDADAMAALSKARDKAKELAETLNRF
jgi:predicted HicB family RNase H-like nuclease